MSLGGERGGGGGVGEIPKGGRAGRARSLGIWPRGGEITGGEIPGTPENYPPTCQASEA